MELFANLPEQRIPVVRPMYYARRHARLEHTEQFTLTENEIQERRKQESLTIYKVVVRLRNRGIRVFRHGPTQHKVGDRIMSSDELVTYALELNGVRAR